MNYSKHYSLLIKRGKSRVLKEYSERHHIIPRCMGGSDDEENLVYLTPEEHYVAHQLLIKMYPNEIKLVYAAMMMIPNRPSNKLYGWLRRRFSDYLKSDEIKEKRRNKRLKEAKYWYEKFKSGNYKSLRDFAKNSDYPYSHVALKKLFDYLDLNTVQGKPYSRKASKVHAAVC